MSEREVEPAADSAGFFKKWLGLEYTSRIYIYSILVGVISGLGAIVFTYLLEFVHFLFVEKLAGFRQVHPDGEVHFTFDFMDPPTYDEHLWLLLLLPAIGGLISGLLVYQIGRAHV